MRNLSPTLLVLLLAPTLSFAVDLVRPSEDGNDWYFGMGGGDPYVNYRQTNRTTLDLEVGAEWSAFTGCSFDPRAGVIQTFKDAKKACMDLPRILLTQPQRWLPRGASINCRKTTRGRMTY